MSYALYAITRKGLKQAEKLWKQLDEADLFVSSKLFAEAPEGARELAMPIAEPIAELFSGYRTHVMFFSVGIAVRMIAPLLVDKRQDPAVICVDENAHWCIPVLSGHRGGANDAAVQIAALLDAQAVLSTASDSSGTLSVDTMGKTLGWTLDPTCEQAITGVASAVVNGDPVTVIQECGSNTWWPAGQPLPGNINNVSTLDMLDSDSETRRYVLITDRAEPLAAYPKLQGKTVIWRPKTLVVGLGCDRDTPLEVIEAGISHICAENGISPLSIERITSISIKSDEQAFIDYAAQAGIPFETFAPEILDGVEGIENPSEVVRKCVGVSSVGEAAALYASGAKKLLVPKTKFTLSEEGKNMTMAVCRRP
ncbi:cobalt-precorrin 5A hydrolase [Parendozoicomonas haliclonae]|uniref:Cobalamin biosynthesis protein CbiG n=1 Tax=Parendozoicomonas haliclonae TaxID=1960125 RepID=A0A1X7ALK5_9GAMM|nr:cobalamin biosynthesis protein [Parendozoicomonas haliclonae]SMA48828.1 cobalamin biosynthesis protein CbiG [Parendozoicomonas haliclonae]